MRNAAASQRFGESLLGSEERWPKQSVKQASESSVPTSEQLINEANARMLTGPSISTPGASRVHSLSFRVNSTIARCSNDIDMITLIK
ncbi:hypothetical protein ALC53_07243 [Atta colombica]|uniref:Uncharacterized protein n=1 Tax=Atta colombica TaxID=520822 RepID=A0A195BCG5_9HYME|nr:hypothetical protein ALC53_07243 [Atta colombica]